MPQLLLLLLAALALVASAGAGVMWLTWRASKKLLSGRSRSEPRRRPDLMRYPHRLRMLEAELESARAAALEQAEHLAEKRADLASKPGRDELVARYEEDERLLHGRAESTERVLGTVWRTRAVLLMRVHLAQAAKQRPELDHLPDPDSVQAAHLGQTAALYSSGAIQVRAFVAVLDERLRTLPDVAPRPSGHARVDDEDRGEVERERAAVSDRLVALRARMDELADSLGYVGDRLRTQHLVEGQRGRLQVTPEAGDLLDQVSQAVDQLDQLAAVGERGLASVAVAALVEDIGDLEQAGLEIDAEAEASREVERLLETFTTTA